MKIVIRPMQDARSELDVTHSLVEAIAGELWHRHGGNEQLNWLDAERHLRRIVGEAGGRGEVGSDRAQANA